MDERDYELLLCKLGTMRYLKQEKQIDYIDDQTLELLEKHTLEFLDETTSQITSNVG